MKTKKIIGLYLTIGIIMFLISNCKKEEPTPPANMTETYLKKSWKLEKYLRNSVDETSLLLIKNYVEGYSDNSVYTRTYIKKNGDTLTETGTWKFEDSALNKLRISGVSSIEITNSGTVSSSYFNILKIEDGVFWYNYINGSDTHEFRLVKK